jgi:hypothetical protein
MLVTNLIQLIRDIGASSEIIDDPEIFDNAASTGRNIARTINGKNYGSIKQVSRDLIATYPMLFSDSISLDSAVIISNAFEHEYTYMISLIINDKIVTSATSASEVVSGFHQNITRYESYESDKVFIDQKFNGSNLNSKTFPKIFNEWGTKYTERVTKKKTKIDYDNIETKQTTEFDGDRTQTQHHNGDDEEVTEFDNNNPRQTTTDYTYNNGNNQNNNGNNQNNRPTVSQTVATTTEPNKTVTKKYKDVITTTKEPKKTVTNQEIKEKGRKEKTKDSNLEIDYNQTLGVSDRDIKKYNDLTPTIMQVTLNTQTKDGYPISKQVAIGVKALIHKLPSAEVALNLSQAVKGSNNLFKFIRWTTGELKLVRDLLLCVDENKKYAKDTIKSDSFWWKKLNDIYKLNKFYKWLKVLSPNKNFKGAIPTATLVISMSDVNNIKSMYGIDLLRQTDLTRKMFDKLSLLTFAIVDESIETLYVYDENNRFFAQYPFRSIKVKKANDGSVAIEDLKPLFKR